MDPKPKPTIEEQIALLRDSHPRDTWNTAPGWDDLSSVRFLVADTLSTLSAENSKLWELADEAILAALTLDKAVGAELIRLRTRLGLSSVSTRRSKNDG